MRVLTDDGYRTVQARASKWPMAGLEHKRSISQGVRSIRFVDGPDGRVTRASYADLYRKNPWVYGAVQVKARGLARLPCKVYRLDEEGNRERVRGDTPQGAGRPTGGANLDAKLKHPNDTTSGYQLKLSTAVDLEIYGNALWKIGRDRMNGLDGLWHVPWKKVSVILGEEVPIQGYEIVGTTGKRTVLDPDQVIHFGRGDDPESPLGTSPMEPLARTTGLMDAMRRFLLAYFRNQARPSGNLKLPPGADQGVLEFIRDEVQEIYSSPENAGRPMVTTGDWQQLSDEPQHSQVVELDKLSREEVCAALLVPPPLLGILDRAIMSNVRELRDHYYQDVIGPEAVAVESDLMSQLLPRFSSLDDLFVEFDMDAMLRPNLLDRAKAYREMRFVYTPNEIRRTENLDPIKDERADTIWMPSNEDALAPDESVEGDIPPPPDDDGETEAA